MNRNMEAIVWAMNARGLAPGPWKVLVMLARRVGKQGFDVWPSHKTIASDCEMSTASVRRYLDELLDKGFIAKSHRYDDRGDQTSNIYQLQVRTRMVFPAGDGIEIEPEDDDGVPVQPPAQSEHGGVLNLSTPPAQSEHTPLLTGEQRTTPIGTYSNEDSPSPNGEAPQGGDVDLFGDQRGPAFDPNDQALLPDRVMEAWNAIAAGRPGITALRKLNPTQRQRIVTRAKAERVGDESLVDVWQKVLDAVVGDPFLRGEAPPGPNYAKPFKNTLDYMLRPAIFSKAVNGGYRDDRLGNHRPASDPATGRIYGPTEQALAGAKQRLGAARPW